VQKQVIRSIHCAQRGHVHKDGDTQGRAFLLCAYFLSARPHGGRSYRHRPTGKRIRHGGL